MRHHGDDCGGSRKGIIGTVSGRIHNGTSRRGACAFLRDVSLSGG